MSPASSDNRSSSQTSAGEPKSSAGADRNPAPLEVGSRAGSRFESTHWSVVLAAAQTESPEAEEAMTSLCGRYWYPLYAFLRRRGHASHEAEDSVQEFFARRVLTKGIFKGVAPGKGRFRTWLLNSLQNFTRNEWDRRQAQKRGGGHPHVPLDFEEGEARYRIEPADNTTPERLFERAWAMTLLDQALQTLEIEQARNDGVPLFEELKRFLPGALAAPSYAEVAAKLGKSEAAVKMAVSRLRQDYGRCLRAEIARTVSSEAELREELRYLLSVLGE